MHFQWKIGADCVQPFQYLSKTDNLTFPTTWHHDWPAVWGRERPQCLNVSIKLFFFRSWQFFSLIFFSPHFSCKQLSAAPWMPSRRGCRNMFTLMPILIWYVRLSLTSGFSLCHHWRLFRANQQQIYIWVWSFLPDKITMIMSSKISGHRFLTKPQDVLFERCGVFPVRVGWEKKKHPRCGNCHLNRFNVRLILVFSSAAWIYTFSKFDNLILMKW